MAAEAITATEKELVSLYESSAPSKTIVALQSKATIARNSEDWLWFMIFCVECQTWGQI